MVVSVDHVSKMFKLRQDNSLKERAVTFGRGGREHSQEFWALRDIDLKIDAGHTVGLIGHNGSGKSTLLKLIGGILSPNSGSVSVRGRMAALLELGAGFHPDLTGRENVYLNASMLGLTEDEIAARFDEIVDFSEIGQFIDTQVKFYSSGMYVRLAFAVAVHTDPDVLLVDEVLAVGDEAFQKKCLDRIRQFQSEGRTIILVTHTLSTVEEMCDRAILLDHGTVVYEGAPATAVTEFRRLLEAHRLQVSGELIDIEQRGRVVGAVARPAGRNFGDTLRVGESLEIELDLRAKDLADWVLEVSLVSVATGRVAYTTDSGRMGNNGSPITGLRRLSVFVDSFYAGAGTYDISLSLKTKDGVVIHEFAGAASITVEPNDMFDGPLYGLPRIVDQGHVSD